MTLPTPHHPGLRQALRRRCRLVVAAPLWLLVAGCAHYDGQPDALGTAKVEAALQPAPLASVRVEAAKLVHPLLPPLVIDGRGGFTPEEVAVMAVVGSPALRALRDQRGVAAAQVVQAGILPNPQLGYSLDQPKGNADPTLINGRNLGLSWELTSLLGRSDRIAGAKAGAAAVDLGIAWQEWQTAQGARLNALRLLALRTRLPLLRQIEDDLAATLAATRQAVAAGQLTVNDRATATDLWLAARNRRLAAEQDERTERSALNLALGLAPDAELALKVGGAGWASASGEPTLAELLEGLAQHRLDLVALTLGYESNEAGLRAAVKAQFPKIGLSFAKANDTSDVRTHTYGVTVDLPLFDRNQGAIAAGRATRRQLFDEYVARVAEARAEVALILANLTATRDQRRAAAAALPEAERLADAYAKARATGGVTGPAYRDARTALAERRLAVADLDQQEAEWEVALEVATGRPLANVRSTR